VNTVRRYLVTLLLLLGLAIVQAQLWWGRGSLPQVWVLEEELDRLKQSNQVARQRNDELANEVRDLQSGLDMVEEHARESLGLVKPDEVFIQFTAPEDQLAEPVPAATAPATR
jgi:cell division protein FtsB